LLFVHFIDGSQEGRQLMTAAVIPSGRKPLQLMGVLRVSVVEVSEANVCEADELSAYSTSYDIALGDAHAR
jgi:hypothetical protein